MSRPLQVMVTNSSTTKPQSGSPPDLHAELSNSTVVDQSIIVSDGVLARNTFYNLLGLGLPMVVAFVAMPVLISGLGTERFGLLSLAWLVVGYFNLFDMGIGLATTKLVAEYRARGKQSELPSAVWTSVAMLAGLGLLGAVIAAVGTPLLITSVLNIPEGLHSEARTMFYILAGTIPVMLGICGFRAVLEGQMRFGIVNAIKVPTAVTTFVCPLLVLPFTRSLVAIVAFLAISRLAVLGAYAWSCIRQTPGVLPIQKPRLSVAKWLVRFGGWLTVSNIISPLMTYLDRFLLGVLLTMNAVAYYVTPYEFATRLSIVAASLLGALFPVFSQYGSARPEETARLYHKSLRYLLAALCPIIVAIVSFAHPILYFWVGESFAKSSTVVLQLLAIGILINSLARVPYGALQASGRPDLTAKLHLAELPLYLLLLWWGVSAFGITGAAIAWLVRVSVDLFVLGYLARPLSGLTTPRQFLAKESLHVSVVLLLGTVLALTMLSASIVKTAMLATLVIASVLVCWYKLLQPVDRSAIAGMVRRAVRRR